VQDGIPSREGTGHLWPSSEQRLLLHAALLGADEAIPAYREWRAGMDLDDDFGWPILRLLPLVYNNLLRLEYADPLMGRMKGMYRRAWVENHQLFNRVRPIIELMSDRGLDILMLKGVPLVLCYYQNYALRPMADVDVAVPRAQAQAAVDCIRDAGWVFQRNVDDDVLRFAHSIECFGPEGQELDLHWHVTYEASTEEADRYFWGPSEPMDFLGIPVRQLDPTALLLHTITHGIRSNPEPPIRWIPDALWILGIRGGDVDWKRLVEMAMAIESPVRLRLGLEFLRRTYNAPIPAWTIEALPRTAVSLRERIDNSVLLTNYAYFENSVARQQWVSFSEYVRKVRPSTPWGFLVGYTHYLRYRWGLQGRLEAVPMAVDSLKRRLAAEEAAPDSEESRGE
jgi:hypothetical protein